MKTFLLSFATIFSGSLLADDGSVAPTVTKESLNLWLQSKPVRTTTALIKESVVRWSPPKTSIPGPAYQPAKIELVSVPRVDQPLSMYVAEDGTLAPRDYKPHDPILTPLFVDTTVPYQVIEGGLKPNGTHFDNPLI